MENFQYYAPTRVIFGKGAMDGLPALVVKTARRVLLAYGGGSIKKTGIYQELLCGLHKCGVETVELSGIEPNPKIESVRRGIELCRRYQLQAIVAVGGGSTVDCCKAVAAGVYYDGDPWDLVLDNALIVDALPLFDVLTLAATGTEMNGNAVISNPATNDKKAIRSESVKPICSILDPTYTYSVPPFQTASGTADIMSHVIEVYFSDVKGAAVQDGISEALLKVCIRYGPRALENPDDYEARANLMWASSLAINGLNSCGTGNAWSCHSMEHQLSAYYDVTHGAGLAVLTPAWFDYILSDRTIDKFVDYGINVWGIDASASKQEIAKEAIARTRKFFRRMGLPATLEELGIRDERYFDVMAEKSAAEGLQEAYVPLTKEDVAAIYRSCAR